MALTDEINQNTQNTSGAQQGSTTPSRPSLLQELVSTQGTEGKNVGYINYALANGGGFGATAAGVVKDESGNLNPIYDFNRSDEEIAYAKARRRGENIDTWYSRAESESTAASERYETLKTQLDELNKSRNRALTASPTAFAVYKNAASQDEISHLEKALEQAQKAVERTSAEFSAAKAYRDYRDTTRPVEEAAERGVSYSDQYEAYSQSLDKLNKQKEELNKQLKAAKNGSGYFGAAATYEQDKARQEEDVKSISEKLEEITRQIARIEGNRNYAERYLTNDADAKQMIQRGLEEEGRLLAEQMEAGRRVLGESDPDAGIATYTKYRGATREGVHVREDWPQEAKDQYYYRLGKYGQQAAEEYAARVNSELNQNAMQQATAGARAFGAQENGNKLQKTGAGALGLGASLTTPLFHAMSYIDKLSAAASGTPYTGRDFALPSDQVNAMVRGRAEQLNKDYGTIDSSTPILGGKGWGDIYQLGQSMVQSLALGNTVGEVGTLAAFFAQSADNAFDEAKARGGNDQYAAMYSVLSGFAEVVGEKISLDHLLKGGKIGSLSYLLKHAGIEGAEEVNTSVLNSFFDRVAADLTGNKTAIEQKIDSLVLQGMSRQDAEKQVWNETISDLAWDFVGGALSGFGSGAVQSSVSNTRNALLDAQQQRAGERLDQRLNSLTRNDIENADYQELQRLRAAAVERGNLGAVEMLDEEIAKIEAQEETAPAKPSNPNANSDLSRRMLDQLAGLNQQDQQMPPRQTPANTPAQNAQAIRQQLVDNRDGEALVEALKGASMPEMQQMMEYALASGQTAKAQVIRNVMLDPTFTVEERPPAHTDEEAPPLKNGTETGTIGATTTQEVNNNAGEQTVRYSEAAEAGATDAGRVQTERQVPPADSRAETDAGRNGEESTPRGRLQRRAQVTAADGSTVEPVAAGTLIRGIDFDGYDQAKDPTNFRTTEGTRIVRKAAKGTRAYTVQRTAETLGISDKVVVFENDFDLCYDPGNAAADLAFYDPDSGKIFVFLHGNADIAAYFDEKGDRAIISTVVHEYVHMKLDAFIGQSDEPAAFISRAKAISALFEKAANKTGFDAKALADYFLNDLGYRAVYNADPDVKKVRRYLRQQNRLAAQTQTNSLYTAMAYEECLAEALADGDYFQDFCEENGIAKGAQEALRSELYNILNSESVFEDTDADFVESALAGDFKARGSSPKARLVPSGLLQASAGNMRGLTNGELRDVLEYALDRASPETKGQPVSERAANLILESADDAGRNAQPRNWLFDRGYQGNTVGNLNEKQSGNLVSTVNAVLNEFDRRGVDLTTIESTVSDYENKFGLIFDENDNPVDLREEPKAEDNRADESEWKSDEETEREWDAQNKQRDVEALQKAEQHQKSGKSWKEAPRGTNFVKEAVPTKPEDQGWIKPVEVSEKEVKQARDAVEAKGKEATIRDRIQTLEAQKKYLEAAAKGMQEARSRLYAEEDVEQRKADLGYLADNIKEQMDQLNADMGYMSDELDDVLAEDPNSPRAVTLLNALDNAQNAANALNVQLEALRDEYKHLGEDSAALRNVRSQIDSVVSEISALSRQLDSVSKRAERADWGKNKRTLFQAEMAENPARETESKHVEPNKMGPYTTPALNKAFRNASSMPKARAVPGTKTSAESANIEDAANSILGTDTLFFAQEEGKVEELGRRGDKAVFRAPEGVMEAMGDVRKDVWKLMHGKTPVDSLMHLTELYTNFQSEDSDMKIFTTPEINAAVKEIQDIFNRKITSDEAKAERLADAAARALTLISTRIQHVDKAYRMHAAIEMNLDGIAPKNAKSAVGQTIKAVNDFFKTQQLNPTTGFKMLDNFQRNGRGPGYQIARQIDKGTATYQSMMWDAMSKYTALQEMEGYDDFARGKSTVKTQLEGRTLTEQQAIDYIKHVRNLASEKMQEGTRLDNINGFSLKTGKDSYDTIRLGRGFTAQDALALADTFENELSPVAKAYLKATGEVMNSLGKSVSDTKRKITGLGFDRNGEYYPLRYHSPSSQQQFIRDSGDMGLESLSFLQDRTREKGGYVMIQNSSETVDHYINAACNYVGYGEVANLLRTLNQPGMDMRGLSNLAGERFGKQYAQMFDQYVKDINNFRNDAVRDDPFNAAMRWGRLHLQQGALGLSVSVPIKQVASYWDAAGVLSPEALVKAYRFKGVREKGGGIENKLLQYRRIGGIDPSVSEVLNKKGFLENIKKRKGILDSFGKATSVMDYRTVDNLFTATVIDTKDSFPDLDVNSAMFEKLVEAKFQEVVLNTQPIFTKNARAAYQRTDNELVRALGMFRTQQTQNYNRMITSMGEARGLRGTELESAGRKQLRQTIAGQIAGSIEFGLLSIAADLVLHRKKPYKDDEGDDFQLGKFVERIALNSFESYAGNAWFADQAAKWAIDRVFGTSESYGVNMGAISTLKSAYDSIASFIDKPTLNNGRYAVKYITQAFGMPLDNAYRALNSAVMYTLDAVNLIDRTKGNRAEYDDVLKMLDSQIKGGLITEEARFQASHAFKRGETENLLYELGVLEAQGDEDDHKGRDWLNKKLTEKDDGLTPNQRILNYLVKQAVSADQMDQAVESYVTASSYNALYEAARGTGLSPEQAIKKLDEIDSNGNGEINKSELKSYYKEHGENKLIEALWGAKEYKTIITDDGEFESFAKLYDAVAATGISMSSASALVDACKNDNGTVTQELAYQYYLAHPDQEAQIKALWKAKGWKTSLANYKPKKTA